MIIIRQFLKLYKWRITVRLVYYSYYKEYKVQLRQLDNVEYTY